jgi:hypothetical protein
VANVLAGNGRCLSCGVLHIANLTIALEFGPLSLKSLSYLLVSALTELSLLDTNHVVGVWLGENLLVLNKLDGGVVVVFVDFTVNCTLDILLFRSGDSLLLDSWVYSLVDGSLMLSISREEFGNGCLRFTYFI